MRRNLYNFITLISLVCIFALSACGGDKVDGAYKVDGEEQAVRIYTCPADNMFGLEKAVVFEDRVIAVFDKGIIDKSEYISLSYDQEKNEISAAADLSNLSQYRNPLSTIEEKDGKYIVTMMFEYDEDNKIDPDKNIEVTGFNVLGGNVDFNDGNLKLLYSIQGGECFDDFWQDYSESTGKWGEIQHETVCWPMGE